MTGNIDGITCQSPPSAAIRLDKWLWQARFFKSRALAGKLCSAGRVRIDGVKIEKAHFSVRIGQVLTFPEERRIRVVRVLGLGTRRGPPSEAQLLYEDLSDPEPVPMVVAVRGFQRGVKDKW
mgnify:CR=1 FL=1